MTSNSYKGPQPRRYSNQDLYPTRWDPRCSSQFPLGNFWPVYLGNFWCEVYSQHATKVQEYFASKGLLVRMVFGRSEKNDPHFHFQKKANLYDFLVYFVRLEDAQDAVSYCHREKYYGHRLNVFPGRTPINMDLSKSVMHSLVQPGKLPLTEQVLEQHLYDIVAARLTCIVKHSAQDFVVQYASVNDRNNAIRKCKFLMTYTVSSTQARQRFLEQDVEKELQERMRKDPSFIEMKPPSNILEALLNGTIPALANQWKTVNKLRMPRKMRLFGKKKTKNTLSKEIRQHALEVFGINCNFNYEARPKVQALNMKKRPKLKQQAGDVDSSSDGGNGTDGNLADSVANDGNGGFSRMDFSRNNGNWSYTEGFGSSSRSNNDGLGFGNGQANRSYNDGYGFGSSQVNRFYNDGLDFVNNLAQSFRNSGNGSNAGSSYNSSLNRFSAGQYNDGFY